MARKFYHISFLLLVAFWGPRLLLAGSEDDSRRPEPEIQYAVSTDAGLVSKYIWRGQRLTDGLVLQPAVAITIGKLSIGAWGNMDLTAVNEGDSLLLNENPESFPGDHSGLQGHFSEVDFMVSYALKAGPATIDVGSIVYSFPDRGASIPSTVEVYGGFTLSDLPWSPSATLYVDVDESRSNRGSTGLYFLLGGEHHIPLGLPRLPGLELSASLGIVNEGFSGYYYGSAQAQAGLHDLNLALNLPLFPGERWSLGAFVNYSALLGNFRDLQYRNPRSVYLGTAGSPATYADTVWGGVNLGLEF